MPIDVIRAVNQGFVQAAGHHCPHAAEVRNSMIGSEWRPQMKGLSADKIADVAAGAIENMRANGTSAKDAISHALTIHKAPVEIPEGIAAKILGAKTPAAVDRKVPKAKQIPEKIAPIQRASEVKKSGSFLAHLSKEQKVGFGISAAFAALSALSTIDALSKITKKDEQGQSHIQLTQVGYALVSGLLTAGLAYAAHQQYHAR